MVVRVLKNGKWRKPHYLRNEVYRAWQRYEWLLDRLRAAFIKEGLGEPSKWKESVTRYQDRVCEGIVACHNAVAAVFEEWENSDTMFLNSSVEARKDDLLEMIEDGSYEDMYPDQFIFDIQSISEALPYVRRSKCKCR